MLRKPLAEPVRQSGEPARPHAQTEVLALSIRRADVRRHAAYYVALYSDYRRGAVAARSLFYVQVYYAVRLIDDAMRHAVAEGVADRRQIGLEPVAGNLRQAEHPRAQVLHKQVRILAVAL